MRFFADASTLDADTEEELPRVAGQQEGGTEPGWRKQSTEWHGTPLGAPSSLCSSPLLPGRGAVAPPSPGRREVPPPPPSQNVTSNVACTARTGNTKYRTVPAPSTDPLPNFCVSPRLAPRTVRVYRDQAARAVASTT